MTDKLNTFELSDSDFNDLEQGKVTAEELGARCASASLNEQVKKARAAMAKAGMTGGKAEGQRKRDLAGEKKGGLVQIARRIARELAVNGPITIDDVTVKMAEMYNVLPCKGKKSQMWKGSVFCTSEWTCLKETAALQKSSHARPIKVWALKTWVQNNPLNGKDMNNSAFKLTRVYSDFKRANPGIDLKGCVCLLGSAYLAPEILATIMSSGNHLYEVPVTLVPNGSGALIMPYAETRRV